MVNSVSGNLYDKSSEARVFARRNKELESMFGEVDIKSAMCFYSADGDRLLQTIENQLEGPTASGDGKDKSLLDWNKYLVSEDDGNSILMMGSSGDLTDVNFSTGQYSVKSEYDFAKERGLISDDAGKVYDVLLFGQNTASFVNYTFDSTGSSQEDIGWDIDQMVPNDDWGNMKYILSRNVNPDYWGQQDASNNESLKSNASLSDMIANMTQWMTADGYAKLDGLTAYSSEWYNKVCELAIDVMDETGSYTWSTSG